MSKWKRINGHEGETRHLRRRLKELESLRRRGGSTLVVAGDELITAYAHNRGLPR